MDLEEAIFKRRTIRRFKQDPVPMETLKKLVDYGRVAPAGSNNQAIEYVIVTNQGLREKIFKHIKWAGALPPEKRTPEEDRRPVAYLIVLLNSTIKKGGKVDAGAAVQNILLGATSFGVGTCWMGAINHKKIHALLKLPKTHELLFVISMGYPDEQSQMEPFQGDYKYWKDEHGQMHVPKRSIDDILLKIHD